MAVTLSIIIVNYKTGRLLCDCLETVFRFTKAVPFEVIVVDNASGDDSKTQVTSRFPQVRWIQLSYNAGFARANNEGIREAKGEMVLLLNSDTLVEDDAIGESCIQFQASQYVACGVQLLNSDRTPQISGSYVMKGLLNYLLPLPYTGAFIKWLGTVANVKKPHVPNADSQVEVDWINGAYLMVKKNAIEKAGLLDEDFFLYAEEAEWCSRLKQVGKLCIYGQYQVIHLQGETANQEFGSSGKGYYNLYDRKGLQIMLSNFVRTRKQLGVGWFLFHLAAYTFTIPVFFIFSFFHHLFLLQNPFADFPRASAYAANIWRIWQFAGTIIKNKPHFYKVL